MTLQQIAYIKANFKNLRIQKEGTGMFTNKDWASAFEINIICADQLRALMKYCTDNNILFFIGKNGIYFQ